MKTSLEYLPSRKVRELNALTELIRQVIPAEMIILFGSYARGEYVEYDQRFDYGVPTIFRSDYDILVLVDLKKELYTTYSKLDRAKEMFYKYINQEMTVQFILESGRDYNNYLAEGRYFYTDIVDEGVLLYDSGRLTLNTPRKLNVGEVKEQVDWYFTEWHQRGDTFYRYASLALTNEDYNFSIFNYHQACESFFHALSLIFTLKKPRQHDLEKLINATKIHLPEILAFFPLHTEDDKRLFKLLREAYIAARYDPKCQINPQDIEQIKPHVELLRQITRNAYNKKIARLNEQINPSKQ